MLEAVREIIKLPKSRIVEPDVNPNKLFSKLLASFTKMLLYLYGFCIRYYGKKPKIIFLMLQAEIWGLDTYHNL